MARIFVALALLGCALAVPTPQSLPESVLGLYENAPGSETSFAEFAKVLNMPANVNLEKRVVLIQKEGDGYHVKFMFWPRTSTIELPFKLGDTQTTTINGKKIEYVYTTEPGTTNETTILHGKFREIDGNDKFTIDITFDTLGYNATYTRDNVVAKGVYRRALPWYVLGTYELDTTKNTDAKAAEFYNSLFPLPKGLSFTKDVKLWIGRHGDQYYNKMIVDPTYYTKVYYRLNEKQTLHYGKDDVEYMYKVKETSANKTTIKSWFKLPTHGKVVCTCVFDHEGATCTTKSDKQEVTSYYKRVLPWSFDGKFEEVPEKRENWNEFMEGDKGCKVADALTGLQFYRKDNGYVVRKTLKTGNPLTVPFTLNGPNEFKTPEGKTVKFNATVQPRGDSLVLVEKAEVQGTDKHFTYEKTVKPCGLEMSVKRADGVVGKKYFRRVVQKAVFGKFEATEVNDDFKKFTETMDAPEMLKKVTLEFGQLPEGKFSRKFTPEGVDNQETTFKLGEPTQYDTKNGHHISYSYYYFELDNKPILRGQFNTTNKSYEVADVFTPEGYTATYTYNNGTQIARRTYKRVGEPVPLEPTPTD